MSSFFSSRPPVEPMIYAYGDVQYPSLLKVGYTTVGVQKRIAQQYPVVRPGERPYRIVLEEAAVRSDGTVFTDNERGGVHDTLCKMGVENPGGEWFRCTVKEVRAAVRAVRERREADLFRTETFGMRPEQRAAVEKASAYFRTFRAETPPVRLIFSFGTAKYASARPSPPIN